MEYILFLLKDSGMNSILSEGLVFIGSMQLSNIINKYKAIISQGNHL